MSPARMFCPSCGKAIQEGIASCPYCGSPISSSVPPPPPIPPAMLPPTPPPFPEKEDLDIVEVLVASSNIIRKKPIVLLPQAIPSIIFTPLLILILPSFLQGNLVTFLSWFIIIIIAAIIVGSTIEGMYPLMVENIIEGQEVDVSSAFKRAIGKLPSLIGAGILVALIVAVGLLLLIVPGIIFVTWYFYTAPAIMLEDLGALDGMSASRKFGRTRKLKTFVILLVLFVVGIVGRELGLIPVVGIVITTLIGIFVSTWSSIIPAYTYIKYAMV